MDEGLIYVRCVACGHDYRIKKGQGWDTISDVSCPNCGHQFGAKPQAGLGTKKALPAGRELARSRTLRKPLRPRRSVAGRRVTGRR